MKSLNVLFILAFSLLNILSTCLASELSNADLNAINVTSPTENIITAGQPTQNDLRALKKAGITTVINLRPDSEKIGFDEKTLVESLGMRYINIPVHGAKGMTKENAIFLDDALKNNSGKSFVHCGSGNRVGGIFAMRAFHLKGKSVNESVQVGKDFGLKSLTSVVKSNLLKKQPDVKSASDDKEK